MCTREGVIMALAFGSWDWPKSVTANRLERTQAIKAGLTHLVIDIITTVSFFMG
jgi:hypothetical protein